MTKEELEDKFEDCFDINTRATGGGYEADTTSRQGLWNSFEPHVLEYTKQQAIAFAGFMAGKINEKVVPLGNDRYKIVNYTFEDRYAQFIERQGRDK